MQTQISHASGHAVDGQHDVSPRITQLLRIRSPAAVAGFVIAVVINAVKRQARRAFAHIRKKCFKRFVPSMADANSSVKVICRLFETRLAAGFHSKPSRVGTANALAAMAVLRPHFLAETPARASFSIREIVPLGGDFSSTFTEAKEPFSDLPRSDVIGCRTNHGESAELFANDGFSVSHNPIIIGLPRLCQGSCFA